MIETSRAEARSCRRFLLVLLTAMCVELQFDLLSRIIAVQTNPLPPGAFVAFVYLLLSVPDHESHESPRGGRIVLRWPALGCGAQPIADHRIPQKAGRSKPKSACGAEVIEGQAAEDLHRPLSSRNITCAAGPGRQQGPVRGRAPPALFELIDVMHSRSIGTARGCHPHPSLHSKSRLQPAHIRPAAPLARSPEPVTPPGYGQPL